MCLEGRLGSGAGQGQQYFLQPDSRMTPNVWDIRPPLGPLSHILGTSQRTIILQSITPNHSLRNVNNKKQNTTLNYSDIISPYTNKTHIVDFLSFAATMYMSHSEILAL